MWSNVLKLLNKICFRSRKLCRYWIIWQLLFRLCGSQKMRLFLKACPTMLVCVTVDFGVWSPTKGCVSVWCCRSLSCFIAVSIKSSYKVLECLLVLDARRSVLEEKMFRNLSKSLAASMVFYFCLMVVWV